jgi:nicotinamide-nucleotide amidase
MTSELEELLGQLGEKFKDKRLSLVTAESCSGGGLAYHISKNPACSSILERGYITYSNKSKEDVFHVQPHTLCTHGAVSEATAREMAEGALKNSKAQVSISLTGIAQDVESLSSPSGVLWIAIASIDNPTQCLMREISGDREEFVKTAIVEALKTLLEFNIHS